MIFVFIIACCVSLTLVAVAQVVLFVCRARVPAVWPRVSTAASFSARVTAQANWPANDAWDNYGHGNKKSEFVRRRLRNLDLTWSLEIGEGVNKVCYTQTWRLRLSFTQWCIGGYTWVYGVYQPPGFFWQRILTSVIINKQGTFRPFVTPVCVYPPPF